MSRPGLGPDDLVLCAGTLASTPLPERIEAAAAAGFQGLSLFLDDLEGARAAGHSDADLRARLADRGLAVAELDPLLTWAPGTEPPGDTPREGQGFFRWREDDFYRAAEAVGARSINAALFASEPIPEDALAEGFAGLCDRAADHGLLVHLEFMPFAQIATLEVALRLVEAAGRPNGGVMLDAWHHFRGGGKPDAVRSHARRILGVQLDDAPAAAEPDPVDETLHRRLLPGEGDAGVVELVRALREGGSPAPLGVEVFSDELAKLPPRELAHRAGDALRAVRARASA